MKIAKERTRLIFTEYNDIEERQLDDLVGTMDKVFAYKDPDGKMICFPTGMEESVKRLFPKIHIDDRSKIYWDYAAITPVDHNAKPRNQLQIDFIEFVLQQANKKRNVAGILSPGQGKTFMACYSAIKVGNRTLIIVPTSSIKGQWAETLVKMFNVPEEKVKLINSPKDFINCKADFVIVSQASLASLNKTYDLEKIMKDNKFGIKVIDEVQMWFQNIINVDANCNIANNWYLTGTFGRSGEEENNLFQEMFSDLAIFREKDKEPTLFNPKPGNIYGMKPHMHVKMMWTHSGLSKEEILKVSSTMRYAERAGKWMRYGISIPAYTKLVIPSDGTMTKFLKNCLTIIRNAEREVKYGRTLILSSTVDSCNILYKHVSEMFPDKSIGMVHSKNTKEENNRVKTECDIIISTDKSAGTGFDAKGLSKLIVLTQYKSWILADQISGRLRRRDDGQDTYMWDIVDADIKQLRAWANTRADVLRRKSKSFKVIDL